MYRPQPKNRLLKNTTELRRLQAEYARLKWSRRLVDASVARSMREIGLASLYDSIREIITTKLNQPRAKQRKTPQQLRLERLKYAREKGNEYSQEAMRQLVEEVYERRTCPNYMPEFGVRAVTYGNYYSERNRLLQKEMAADYDQEYQMLLLRCAMFEKEHPDVRGFLDQKILCGTGYSLATDTTSSQNSKESEEDLSQPEDAVEEAPYKDMGVQVSDRNFCRDVLLWSQADTFTGKISDTDSDFEESDQDDYSYVVEKIGDH